MKKDKKILPDKEAAQQAADAAKKAADVIPDETLGQVTGAGNPFDKVPRVPTQPIDDELREDG